MVPRFDDLMKRTVADIMTSEFIYVRIETKLTRVLQLMVDHRLRRMPAIENDQRLAGMISREDVMRARQRCAGKWDRAPPRPPGSAPGAGAFPRPPHVRPYPSQ